MHELFVMIILTKCLNRDWLTTYQFVDGVVILMRNNISCKIIDIEIIQIEMYEDIVRILFNV